MDYLKIKTFGELKKSNWISKTHPPGEATFGSLSLLKMR